MQEFQQQQQQQQHQHGTRVDNEADLFIYPLTDSQTMDGPRDMGSGPRINLGTSCMSCISRVCMSRVCMSCMSRVCM